MGIYNPIETLTSEKLKLKLAEFRSTPIKTKNGLFYPNAESLDTDEINVRIKAVDGKFEEIEEG